MSILKLKTVLVILIIFVVTMLFLTKSNTDQCFWVIGNTGILCELSFYHYKRIDLSKANDDGWLNRTEGIHYSNYGDGSCESDGYRETLVHIFKHWHDVAITHNITYFITCGSLLGAWRNEDKVPGDSDLDVLINKDDAIKLEQIKSKRNFNENDKDFHLILQEDWRLPYDKRRRFKCDGKKVERYSDHCSFQEPLARLITDDQHMDIYDYTLNNDTLIDPSEWMKEYPSKDIFPLKKCNFMGLQTYCPKKPRVILDAFYKSDLYPLKICINGKWKARKS